MRSGPAAGSSAATPGFAGADDASGMRIAAASVVIAFIIEYGDIRTLETWLRRHVDAGGERPSSTVARTRRRSAWA